MTTSHGIPHRSFRVTDASEAMGPGEATATDVPEPELGQDAVLQRRHVVALLLITLLGAWLRLHGLAEWSFWVDEAHTWRDATLPLARFFDSERGWYPGSYLLLRWLLDLGVLQQPTEGWLRLPFAFCGIVSVPLLALVGAQLVGTRAALLSALLLTLNPWHVFWSQNARGYVLVFFFSTLAATAFWRGIRRRSRGLCAAGVGLALLGGAFHPTGLMLLSVFLAYPLLLNVQVASRRFALVACAAGAAVFLLPSLIALLPPFQAFMAAKPDASLVHLVQTTAYYFRVPLLLAAMLGVWLLFQARMQGRVLFLACWALVPLLVLSMLGTSVVKVTARYAFCALPAVVLLAGAASVRMADVLAKGLGSATRVSRTVPALVLPAILCLDMAAYDYLYAHAQHGDRGLWRQASRYVAAAAEQRPFAVLTVNGPSMEYYLRPNHYRGWAEDPHPGVQVRAILHWDVTVAGGGRDYLLAERDRLRAAGAEMFVVVGMPELIEIDQDGSLRTTLRREFELVHVLPCWVGPKDESIWIYRPRTS